MTIKKKLYLNMIAGISGLAMIAGFSLIGMKFVQGNLFRLTERSTPYQLKTIDLQKSLQEHTSNLMKIASAHSLSDYTSYKSEAEKTMENIRKASEDLAAFKGGSEGGNTINITELSEITDKMAATTGERLTAEEEAVNADITMMSKLTEVKKRLTDLDSVIKKLQTTSVEQLVVSSANSKAINLRLKEIQEISGSIKEALAGALEIHGARNKAELSIGKNIVMTAVRAITQKAMSLKDPNDKTNAFSKSIIMRASDISKLISGSEGAIEIREAWLANPDKKELHEKCTQLHGFLKQKISDMAVLVQDEMEKSSDRFAVESRNLEESLSRSNAAGDILSLNSELISLGFNIEGLIGRLSGINNITELESVTGELVGKFDRAAALGKKLGEALASLKRSEEVKLIKTTAAALSEVEGLLFGDSGVTVKLKRMLNVKEQASNLSAKLREIVAQQKAEGAKGMTLAQDEQEKAVKSVNTVVRTYVMGVIAVGLFILIVGVLFSRTLVHSILSPINELTTLAEGFGKGDFSIEMNQERDDEFGRVALNFNQAQQRLRDITSKLRQSIIKLSDNSGSLTATSITLNKGTSEQSSQTEQSATASREMSQTTNDVARNASDTAETATMMKQAALQGKDAMSNTARELQKFAETVNESANKVELLGSKSEQISKIVTLIKEIAEQTNLLALNAAIEAARAGEQGRGFAVVADSVRQLAEKTSVAADDISRTVRDIQKEVVESVNVMKDEKKSVGTVISHIDNTLNSINEIVTYVGRVTDMVQNIASAADQQTAASEQVSHSMASISSITSELNSSASSIDNSAKDLSTIASELNTMVSWFKA
ncbi:MAG: methyl-accepting chemotaxis protein [Nitrospiraceae bacterium]|nr:MAG: methyl-accepting chemotaxis protein [Nitrospiraceae bacterium]